MQRVWDKDPFIRATLNSFCFDSDSIIQKIDNSLIFKEWFAAAVKRTSTSVGADVRNLKAAKHRFESEAKPLGRFVMHIQAVMEVAHLIDKCRVGRAAAKDDSCRIARQFLQTVTAERLLQTAMAADALDEGLTLCRFFDQEKVDLAAIQGEIAEYFERLDYLFLHGACLTTKGYTSLCKAVLTTDKLQAITSDGVAIALASPDEETETRCLERMRNWVQLCKEIAATEFPNHDLFMAFGALNIDEGGVALRRTLKAREPVEPASGNKALSADIRRLASAFKVDGMQLAHELEVAKPVASRILQSLQVRDNRVAWTQYAQRTQSRPSTSASHPMTALGPVLARSPDPHLRVPRP